MKSSALAASLEASTPALLEQLRPSSAAAQQDQRLLSNLIESLRAGRVELAPGRACSESTLDRRRAIQEAVYQLLDERDEPIAPRDAQVLSEWLAVPLGDEHGVYGSLLDALHDHVVLHDADGRILYMNRAAVEDARRITGVPRPIGRTVRELLDDPAVVTTLEGDIARSFAGETFTNEALFPGRAVHWREYLSSPWRAPDGQIAGAVFVSRDVHARKIAETRLKLLSKIGALADNLEYEGVLPAVARLSVADLADVCVLDVVEQTTVRRAKVAHRDPGPGELADELLAASPEDAYRSARGRQVIEGEPQLVAASRPGEDELVDAVLGAARDRLAPHSALVVPVVVLGRTIAVATFVRTAAFPRPYDDEDLAIAVEVVRRAASIVENARLQQELRDRDAALRVALAKSNICVFQQDAQLRYQWIYNSLVPESELARADDTTPDKLEVLATGKRSRKDLSVVVDGQPRRMIATHEPLRGATGEVIGIIGSIVDVTEEKRIQRDLSEALDFRDRVIGILGHDLRNPLSAVMGIVGLAKLDPQLPAFQREHLQQIDIATRRMVEMIKTLLDFTQARFRGKFPISPAPMDLRELCEQVTAEARAGHPGLAIELEVRGDLRGGWDGARIAQVVSNLVGNAIAHGDPRAPIRLSMTGEASHVELQVHNQGPPVAPELLPFLFDPFRRGDSSRPRGLGLGLYIVQQIVLAHGGSVAVSSKHDEGTTFVLRLPRSA